ncbi:hypothetical protein TD95_005003 [Thielaviopsis punctulata]|uniref:Carotenoid oxygenase n=1 Tax=Thielaviopsis punctulata TaxID=72032 RepID=A0A0F4ZB09_9PEZI|nr:hypothetical protein TD95_005003 [Thielaviopsis punctulata]
MPTLNSTSAVFSRSAADADSDERTARDNFNAGQFDQWPNDAGFSGLTEQRGPLSLAVTGSIPPWAAGSLYRTGPAVYAVDRPGAAPYTVKHWFDGLGQTHKFDIIPASDGNSARVVYSSRRQSDGTIAEIKAGRQRDFTFAQGVDPCVGLFGKAMAMFKAPVTYANVQVTVNANIGALPNTLAAPSVVTSSPRKSATSSTKSTTPPQESTAGHRTNVQNIWLATDGPALLQLDPLTLKPSTRTITIDTAISHLTTHASCAHAAHDPHTGEFFNFSLRYGPTPEYAIFRLPPSTQPPPAKPTILARLHGARAPVAYIHSVFLTENYFVMCIPSARLALHGLAILWHRTILESMQPFSAEQLCFWHVISRQTGAVVARFETPAAFFFHSTNAFERDGRLFCEMLEYPNTDILRAFYLAVMRDADGHGRDFWKTYAATAAHMGALRRYMFDLGGAAGADKMGPAPEVVMQIRGPHVGELPTINPAYAMREHRYVYSVVARGLSTMFDALSKADMQTGNVLLWSGDRGHTPGEPIFVTDPEGKGEDDGVLLSVVLDGINGTSYLLCLDAKTMEELGRAECGFAIGLGFHGLHAKAI